jgi:hypothetical protein
MIFKPSMLFCWLSQDIPLESNEKNLPAFRFVTFTTCFNRL